MGIKKIPKHPSVGKWTLQFIASAVKLIKVSAIAIYVDIHIVKALQKATGLVLGLQIESPLNKECKINEVKD